MPKFASAASSGVFLRALVTVLNDPNVLSMHRWCQRYYTTFQRQCVLRSCFVLGKTACISRVSEL